jgi:hypothetical protein
LRFTTLVCNTSGHTRSCQSTGLRNDNLSIIWCFF